jgi:large subunit ribosomal protein L7/L12
MFNLIKISARSIKTSTIYRNVQAASATAEKLSIPVPEGSDKPFNPKLDTIVNQIASLNILEVSELSSLLKKKLNLPETAMAMPMGFAQGGAAAAPCKITNQFLNETSTDFKLFFLAEEDEEAAAPKKVQTAFKVKMLKFDDKQKVALIKEIKNLFEGMNLVQAKKFVESVPTLVKEDISKEEAEKLKESLSKIGAVIEIE